MRFLSEFKQFAMRGNVLDLAVAVVIGASFNKIISSFVDGIIMPVIGLLLGGVNITNKFFKIGDAIIKWGAFLQAIINFVLIAFAIFVAIKFLNVLQLRREEKEEKQANTEINILAEIRDLLKKAIHLNK